MRVYTVALSVIVHLVALVLIVAAPLVATDALPEPHRIVEFVRVTPSVLPAAPPALRSRSDTTPRPAPSTSAPIEAPPGIEPEPDPSPQAFDSGPSSIENIWFDQGTVRDDPAPPPPAPPERDPIRVGGAITRPERLRQVSPIYPPVAREARIEGIVILEAVIETDGRVADVRVLRSVPLLDDAAIDSVRQWVYTPTLLNGEPVRVVMTVTVTFRLQ